MIVIDRCLKCGRPASEHCVFEPLPLPPAGCVCGIDGSWGNPASIPPICGHYEPSPDGNCIACEHDKECHE